MGRRRINIEGYDPDGPASAALGPALAWAIQRQEGRGLKRSLVLRNPTGNMRNEEHSEAGEEYDGRFSRAFVQYFKESGNENGFSAQQMRDIYGNAGIEFINVNGQRKRVSVLDEDLLRARFAEDLDRTAPYMEVK